MIYLDNAATTQPTKAVLEVYQQAQQQLFFNSESLHIGGEQVRAALDHSRSYLQRYFQTNKEVLFSTSGSHANAIAINLYLSHFTSGTVWVSPYEHPSIHAALDPYKAQFDIKRMPLTETGEIDVTQFEAAMTTDVVLIIMQHVNSETGYILPIQAIGRIAENWQVPLHVDGVQAVHKIPNYTIEGCTSYSCAGHKFHGVKGTGMLLSIMHGFIRIMTIIFMKKALEMARLMYQVFLQVCKPSQPHRHIQSCRSVINMQYVGLKR